MRTVRSIVLAFVPLLALSIFFIAGCRNDPGASPADPAASRAAASLDLAKHGAPVSGHAVLVADIPDFNPVRVDATLKNPWGMAVTPTGIFWISANHTGISEVFDSVGNVRRPPVAIPTTGGGGAGEPTGVVFNSTAAFVIPSTGQASRFIFVGEDGVVTAWGGGDTAHVVADRSSADAVYKGLAMAWQGSHWALYATNFKGGTVDVFDDHFQYDSSITFNDPGIPAGYGPFGIAAVGHDLFVTYAKHLAPDNQDDEAGPGNGYVDVYGPDGSLKNRFASQGTLNSPWGIAPMPDHAFDAHEDGILIGNFGDGRINVFDKHGRFHGQLTDSSKSAVTIPGLWGLLFRGIAFSDSSASLAKHGGDGNGDGEDGDGQGENDGEGHEHTGPRLEQVLYFTAGPNTEANGIFGYLRARRK